MHGLILNEDVSLILNYGDEQAGFVNAYRKYEVFCIKYKVFNTKYTILYKLYLVIRTSTPLQDHILMRYMQVQYQTLHQLKY